MKITMPCREWSSFELAFGAVACEISKEDMRRYNVLLYLKLLLQDCFMLELLGQALGS